MIEEDLCYTDRRMTERSIVPDRVRKNRTLKWITRAAVTGLVMTGLSGSGEVGPPSFAVADRNSKIESSGGNSQIDKIKEAGYSYESQAVNSEDRLFFGGKLDGQKLDFARLIYFPEKDEIKLEKPSSVMKTYLKEDGTLMNLGDEIDPQAEFEMFKESLDYYKNSGVNIDELTWEKLESGVEVTMESSKPSLLVVDSLPGDEDPSTNMGFAVSGRNQKLTPGDGAQYWRVDLSGVTVDNPDLDLGKLVVGYLLFEAEKDPDMFFKLRLLHGIDGNVQENVQAIFVAGDIEI